ncbi:putative pre-16S rRNA nuclease [bioreactor metagenome]|uniref:Putative pre-16S rRNA nuclease n=1 Tax=bioreactor metagenome TaxID=1076179 RepID=A0A644UA37_9ZZZZ|nr:Holliday junction resolvase RuvX [Candidatus Elulimicrobiales bacterium]
MKKYLGIDYGSKKIGLATSDEEGKFAFPFSIISNKNKEEAFQKILNVLKERKIENIVIGESLNLKGEENKILKETKDFAEKLEKENFKIFFEKEWLSTIEARRFDDRKDADDSAAAIILQRFLDKSNRG